MLRMIDLYMPKENQGLMLGIQTAYIGLAMFRTNP